MSAPITRERNPESVTHADTDNQTAGHSRLELLERLQITLDLDQLLNVIHKEVGHRIAIDGLEYHHESLAKTCLLGQAATHSCGYRLLARDADAGELIFRRQRTFREQELNALESLIPHFFAPLRNALRFRKAMDRSFRDEVSGARNERSLWQILPREIALARRHNRPLSGILLDVRRMARINRENGHDAGDAVLQSIVQYSASLCRETDLLFRVEDDTLLVLLQETDENGARRLADRLTRACAEQPIALPDRRLPVQIRVSHVTASGTDSASSFITRGLSHLARTE